MSEPKVVNLRREQFDLYIGRAPGRRGVFGNPYALAQGYSRLEAIRLFERDARDNALLLEAIRRIPPGTRLGCFCKPLECHGDVIVKLWKEMHEG